MATPAIHVVPRGNRRWAVEREGATRPASMHPTQAEVISFLMILAGVILWVFLIRRARKLKPAAS